MGRVVQFYTRRKNTGKVAGGGLFFRKEGKWGGGVQKRGEGIGKKSEEYFLQLLKFKYLSFFKFKPGFYLLNIRAIMCCMYTKDVY